MVDFIELPFFVSIAKLVSRLSPKNSDESLARRSFTETAEYAVGGGGFLFWFDIHFLF